MVTKRYSRLDNVFSTSNLTGLIMQCEVDPTLRPPSTDHFPIVTKIMLPQERIEAPPSYNFREVDWEDFERKLKTKLNTIPNPQIIKDQEQLASTVERLTLTIQDTIQDSDRKSSPVFEIPG
jgi:hypothetical protein